MELSVDPSVYPDGEDLLEFSGTRAKGRAVNRVDSALALVHLIGGRIRFVFFRGRKLGECYEGGRYHPEQKRALSRFGGHGLQVSLGDYEPGMGEKLLLLTYSSTFGGNRLGFGGDPRQKSFNHKGQPGTRRILDSSPFSNPH